MIKRLISVIWIILLITEVKANIIRDSEIEETIELVVAPLKKASGLNDLKIYLLNDEVPNAFTAGGMVIFINSGLIINFPDPDVLRGVVAHEIGHILGKHVIRRQEVINNYEIAAMGSAALGLATAISTGAPGIAVMLAGMHVSERSIKAYSRTFESSADQAALRLLEKTQYSAVGMIKFFQQAKIESKSDLINPYEQTHPLTHDRLRTLKNENKKSKYGESKNSTDLIYKFQRVAVKLSAYTLAASELPSCDYKENQGELTLYMKAIKCFRVGNFDDALNHINRLLMTRPKDPFYQELKAQILFEAGKSGALDEYEVVYKIRNKDPLIVLGRAIVGITLYKNDPLKLVPFYQDLQFVIAKEPDNLLALYYMAIYYEAKGLQGKSYLNSAIIADKLGHQKNARELAKAAMKNLQDGSPSWYKAHDILEANK